jgi:hypothetical protein
MQSYKIILRQEDLEGQQEVNSNLVLSNDYLVNQSLPDSLLVNENNVRAFLDDPKNTDLVNGFINYLQNNTTKEEFDEIVYDNKKLSSNLNEYYVSTTTTNQNPNIKTINNAISGTTEIVYKTNIFENVKKRKKETKTKLEQISTEGGFYIPVMINTNPKPISLLPTNKFAQNCTEDGTLYVQCFVDLNKNDNPFKGLVRAEVIGTTVVPRLF